MKVLQFIASKGWGGAEKSFVELCNALSTKIDIEVLLFEENKVEGRLYEKIKVHKLSSNSNRHNPFLYVELFKLIKKVDPDVIHTHSAKASEIIDVLSKFIRLEQVATKRNSRKGKIFDKLKNVTAISFEVAKTIHNKNVHIIHNGIIPDVDFQMPKRKESPVFTIFSAGRLDKIKGYDILIKEVSKLDFPFQLYIAGEGDEKENLESVIREHGVSDKVNLLGFRNDIPSLIATADLVVISSHSEGLSRILLETLFYGHMIISTKVSGSVEILPSQLLIDNFDIAPKIADIYNNHEHYIELFKHLKEKRTKEFLLENIIEQYIDLYQRILGEDG